MSYVVAADVIVPADTQVFHTVVALLVVNPVVELSTHVRHTLAVPPVGIAWNVPLIDRTRTIPVSSEVGDAVSRTPFPPKKAVDRRGAGGGVGGGGATCNRLRFSPLAILAWFSLSKTPGR